MSRAACFERYDCDLSFADDKRPGISARCEEFIYRYTQTGMKAPVTLLYGRLNRPMRLVC